MKRMGPLSSDPYDFRYSCNQGPSATPPSLTSLGMGTCSRPQQETDLWIGQNSLRRSLMEYLLIGNRRNPLRAVGMGFRNLSAQDGLLQSLPEGGS